MHRFTNNGHEYTFDTDGYLNSIINECTSSDVMKFRYYKMKAYIRRESYNEYGPEDRTICTYGPYYIEALFPVDNDPFYESLLDHSEHIMQYASYYGSSYNCVIHNVYFDDVARDVETVTVVSSQRELLDRARQNNYKPDHDLGAAMSDLIRDNAIKEYGNDERIFYIHTSSDPIDDHPLKNMLISIDSSTVHYDLHSHSKFISDA